MKTSRKVTSAMTLDSLPPEIMFMILVPSHFTTLSDTGESLKDYINLRLVSQTFSAIVTPHIFQHLQIKSSECSLKRLEAISENENLKRLVKTYSYTFVHPQLSRNPPLTPTRIVHDEYLRLMANPFGTHDPSIIRSSKDPAMLKIAHWLNQRDFELSNDLHQLHIDHLSHLPNLKSICLESPPSCGLSDVPYDLNTATGIGRPWGPVAFRAILLAIYNRSQTPTITPLEDLTIKGISEECMLLPPSFITKALTAMSTLLHLHLCIRTLRETSEPSTPGWILLLGRLIQSTPSLTSLTLEVQENATDIFFRPLVAPTPSTIPYTRWKHLSTLHLQDTIFTSSHILSFLASHPSLRSVQFTICHLRVDPDASSPQLPNPPNPWLAVLRALRKHHPPGTEAALTHFCVQDLYYGCMRHKRMHLCELTIWRRYILGMYPREPGEAVQGGEGTEWCVDCKEEEVEEEEGFSSGESEGGYFFDGGFGGFWGSDVEEEEEEDEEEEYFVAPQGVGGYGMGYEGQIGWDAW